MSRLASALFGCAALAAVAGPLSARAEVLPAAAATADTADAAFLQHAPAAPETTGAPPATPAATGGFFGRLFDYYKSEWGQTGPAPDPNAPPSRRDGTPPQPENTPPIPFTEWPYGGTTNLLVNRPSSVDSPLMAALAPTPIGKTLNDAHIQVYGWVDVGGNLSTNHHNGGNSPAAYDYSPNTVQMDQAVLYVERTPDTVQKDHIDWGFRVAAIYGVDYRYTTSFGVFSDQYLKHNNRYGYDLPMVYGELFVPQVAQGLLIRAGRFISLPDIEAQLAPNNYMYSHSITYTFDNYTNTGVQATLAATKNLFLQFGVTAGSDTAIWNVGVHEPNPFPNPLYPGTRYLKDPGAKPSYTGCVRYQTDSANDNIYICADAINNGVYGYNNLQWYGVTYYHRFNAQWHVAFESYNLHQSDVPNVSNPVVQNIIAHGGTPFSNGSFPFNGPNGAQCKNIASLKCTATAQSLLTYINYQPRPLDNLSLRLEYYNDMEGQRTGVATEYYEATIGLQHWLSPQIELRPELAYYHAGKAAFNGNSNLGIAPNRQQSVILSGDAIFHF